MSDMLAKQIVEKCPAAHIAQGLIGANGSKVDNQEIGSGCACEGCIARALRPLFEKAALADKLAEALRELVALANGECPSLLNEDSGGDSKLDLEIASVIAEYDKLRGEK